MDKENLDYILKQHKKWLESDGGERANLCDANLCDASLRDANLSDADLRNANLSGADLRDANVENVKSNHRTVFFALQCPEKGAYRAFKKASGYIVELEITGDALRSSATSRKCRASKARVISITNVDGTVSVGSIASNYDHDFIYEVGKTVEAKDFDTDRWNECSSGIHHFITREEVEQYG